VKKSALSALGAPTASEFTPRAFGDNLQFAGASESERPNPDEAV
jgi:hypothetical protein